MESLERPDLMRLNGAVRVSVGVSPDSGLTPAQCGNVKTLLRSSIVECMKLPSAPLVDVVTWLRNASRDAEASKSWEVADEGREDGQEILCIIFGVLHLFWLSFPECSYVH